MRASQQLLGALQQHRHISVSAGSTTSAVRSAAEAYVSTTAATRSTVTAYGSTVAATPGLVKFLEWLVARWATKIKSLVAPNAYR